MTYVLERLAERRKELSIEVKCVPTSFQSKQLVHQFKLPCTDLDSEPVIDLAIDGADEVDHNFVAIKGGGACLLQEKIVAAAAKKFIVVADYRKDSQSLGQTWKQGIPIEVVPMSYNSVRHQLVASIEASKLEEFILRIAKRKAGPVITDNGNFIIDWVFNSTHSMPEDASGWKDLAARIKLIPGVVETGIFAGMISKVYFGHPDNEVDVCGPREGGGRIWAKVDGIWE